MMPATKLSTLRGYMARGDWRAALKLAASFYDLGAERDVIRTAWDALAHPDFYRQLGKDPEALERAGRAALERRYSK